MGRTFRVSISGSVTSQGDFSLKVEGERDAFDDPQITPHLSIRPQVAKDWYKIAPSENLSPVVAKDSPWDSLLSILLNRVGLEYNYVHSFTYFYGCCPKATAEMTHN